MKTLFAAVMAFVLVSGAPALASSADLAKDIEMLKQKITELEKQLQEQSVVQKKAIRQIDEKIHNDTSLNLLDAYYTHEFFDKTLKVTGGKAKNLMFLDGNAFANNEKQQFVGKPFVNNSVLDSESEYTPLLEMELKPTELLALSLVATSTSRPDVEGTPLEDTAKSKYDNVFSIAVTENLAFSPDLQYVVNPGGDSNNDPVFAGVLRAEFNF